MKKDTSDNRKLLFAGAKDGIPIGLGYLAVGFSLGIVAAEAGMNAAEGFLASLLCNASAGQYAGYTLMAANATLLELIVMMLIINARYLLMSFALSQRVDPDLPVGHRLLMSNYITDEIFGISIAQGGSVKPQYMYGAAMVASPMWAAGNALGIIAGNILPLSVSSALSVALYGMLTSVIIPPAKKDRVVAVLIAICFAASWAASTLPVISGISEGTRTIILTLLLAGGAAALFPRDIDGGATTGSASDADSASDAAVAGEEVPDA